MDNKHCSWCGSDTYGEAALLFGPPEAKSGKLEDKVITEVFYACNQCFTVMTTQIRLKWQSDKLDSSN